MKDGIATRVGRIISGSVNALIDAVESAAPTVMMEEAIREINGAIEELRSDLKDLVANRRMANTRLMEENRRHEDLAEKIVLAVQEDRDDLAGIAISQQLDIEAQIPVLERTIAEGGEREKELNEYVSALQARRREMTDELRSYLSSRDRAGAGTTDTDPSSPGGDVTERAARRAQAAEVGFDRILEQQTGLSRSTSQDEKTAARLTELEEMARANRVQERLLEIRETKKK